MSTKMVRTHVVLPEGLIERIDQRAGPRKRSEYIAAMIEQGLRMEERVDAWEELRRVLPTPWGIPGEDTSDPTAYISRMRREESEDAWARGWGRFDQAEANEE